MRTARYSAASAVAVAVALATVACAWNASASDQNPELPAARREVGLEPPSPGNYRITGRVTDQETGRPIPGSKVQVVVQDPSKGGTEVKSTFTGEDGVYTMALPPGHGNISTTVVPIACYWMRPDFDRGLEPFALSEVEPVFRKDYAVRRGTAWEFRLAPSSGGTATGRWTVTALGESSSGFFIDTPDSHAEANVQEPAVIGLPSARGEVTGTATFLGDLARVAGTAITLNDQAGKSFYKLRWEGEFQPGAVRSVSRLDGAGSRFWITDHKGRCALFESLSSEPFGRFEPSLEDGRLVIRAHLVSEQPGLLPEVVGTVVDQMSAPVAGATVEVVYLVQSAQYKLEAERCRTSTGSEGRYRLGNLPRFLDSRRPSAIRVIVSREGCAGVDSEPIEVRDVPFLVAPPIVLRPGCSASGRVLDAEGRPVVGAEVEPDGGFAARARVARTDDEGRFEVHGLPEGAVRLIVRYGRATAEARADLRPGGEPPSVTIRLPPSGAVR